MKNALLQGPILRTLLKLAAPNVLAMTTAVLVGVAETWYVGKLGTTQLAAMALVFPFVMLTQMMSNGAMGGGVSSAISRALGAADQDRATALGLHASVIGTLGGVLNSVVFLAFGPELYRLLGGRGEVLDEAVRFSNILFCGAILVWVTNTLASVLRGTGEMRVPSATMLCTAALQVTLGGVLTLGAGPIPSLGMKGVAIGYIVASAAAVMFLSWYLFTGHARVQPRLRGVALNGEMFHDILKVGAIAILSPMQSVATAVVLTGLVARIGVKELAGFGIGQRLEFMLVPIAFGIGVASVPMVGMSIGAGNVARARRVAWTAGGVSAFNLGIVGLVVAAVPDVWSTLFSSDPAVLGAARLYLRCVGPAFAAFGLGLTLYFASQGSGRIVGPVLCATLRLTFVGLGGLWLAAAGGNALDFFLLIAAGMCVYGAASAAVTWATDWTPRPRTAASR